MKGRTSPSPSEPSQSSAARPSAGALLGARLPGLAELWRKRRGLASGSSILGREEIAEAGAALLALQRGLTGGRSLVGRGYMDDDSLLGAYLLYYWPVSYLQFSLALAERPCSPRRVLDLGSGPGPASAAILDAMAPRGQNVQELVLVDASGQALDLATALLVGEAGQGIRLAAIELDLESDSSLPMGPFDLISMGHCLNELWASEPDALERRTAFVERAAERLAPDGRILLVEPALLSTSRALTALRDALAGRGYQVLGPCPGSYPCPALAAGPDRSCHAAAPWEAPEPVASLAKAAGLDRSAVKFSYFLLQAPPGSSANPRQEQSVDSDLRRVVSEPMLNKAGRLRYLLCGDGRLEALSARSDDPGARARGFTELRRGDELRPRGLEKREGGGLGLLRESELGLQALAPEPAE
jgi:SAM-dependent methyltransferase